MLWDSGLEKLGQQWNQVWSAVEFYDAFAGPDGSNFSDGIGHKSKLCESKIGHEFQPFGILKNL